MIAQGVEDHPRVPAPDVQDVGADGQGIAESHGLLEQV